MSENIENGSTRGRKAVPLEDKIANAVSGKLSSAGQAFFNWLSDQVTITLDPATFALTQSLYQEYTKTEEFQQAAAKRKAEREQRELEKLSKEMTKFEELARKLGKKIIDIDEEDDDDEITSPEDDDE